MYYFHQMSLITEGICNDGYLYALGWPIFNFSLTALFPAFYNASWFANFEYFISFTKFERKTDVNISAF